MHILDERFAPGQIDLEGDWRATRPTARLANLLAAGRAHQPVTEVQHGRATRGDPSVVTNANRLRRFRTVTITDPSARWDIEPTTVEIGPQQEVEDAMSTTPSAVTDPVCVMAIEAGSAVASYVP